VNTELEDELGDIVQKARDAYSWSQLDLALNSGIPFGDLARIENCEVIPENAVIEILARSLNLHAPSLLKIAHKRWGPGHVEPDPDFDLVCLKVYMGIYPVQCYLLTCNFTGETALIDTGGNPEIVIKSLKERNLIPTKILLTHSHPDHAGGLGKLDTEFNCPAWIDVDEPKPFGSRDLRVLRDGDLLILGRLSIKILTNPGHTPGGCSYLVKNSLICGDAIFAGSMGRANVSFSNLYGAVKNKILTLPDKTSIHPGHGPATTVGEEKCHNPFFFTPI
tara:strand:- start:2887 stop:3720 length:834 start_codon:yes stop_codon:yes gene_type:complete